jgi:hypothetical protein
MLYVCVDACCMYVSTHMHVVRMSALATVDLLRHVQHSLLLPAPAQGEALVTACLPHAFLALACCSLIAVSCKALC